MSAIRSTTGLASGLDIGALTESLVLRQRSMVARFESRSSTFEQRQTAVGLIEANVLTLQSAGTGLSERDNFQQRSVSNTNDSAVRVDVDEDTPVGSLSVQSVQLVSSQSELSRGFASPDSSLGSSGQIVIRQGGRVADPTRLELLNGGAGVSGGSFKITAADGESATIDLADAVTIDDVIAKVDAAGIDVRLSAHGDALRLTDTSGGAGLLEVEDQQGTAASDLGLVGTSATGRLDGTAIFELTDAFTLDFLSDGNGPFVRADGTGNPDLTITASDGSTFDVVLDDAETIADVVAAINDATDNGGAVVASFGSGRLSLTDTTGGIGTLTVEDNGNSAAIESLGLTTSDVGGVITGKLLHGGMNTVLLRSLNGGRGVETPGTIAITNSNGEAGTVDLSSAETLQDVVDAINGATTALAVPLGVIAEIDEAGTGLKLTDTSGGGGTLTIADTVGTTAADLGLSNASVDNVIATGGLNLRTVNEATTLQDITADGESVDSGLFQITDSAGGTAAIRVNSSVRTVGDLIARINAEADIDVTAELNETGDGFVLIDNAGGAGSLTVDEIDGTTAADLRLLGDVVTGGDGKQRITSRDAIVVNLTGDETLEDLVAAVNDQSAFASASLVDDGSRLNPSRFQLDATQAGLAGALTIETTGVDLGLLQTSRAADAVARIGDNPATSFVLTSDSNRFRNVAGGVDIELLSESDEAAQINVTRDFTRVRVQLESYIEGYNQLMSSIDTATSFSPETNQRGVLQGDSFVLRVEQRFTSLFLERSGPDRNLQSLTALGVEVSESGELSLNTTAFNEAIEADPDAVENFFADDDRGFGTKLADVVETLTDPIEGSFTTEKNALQASIDAITQQIDDMNELLELRQERLYRDFVRMETIVADLQAQQQTVAALGGIAPAG